MSGGSRIHIIPALNMAVIVGMAPAGVLERFYFRVRVFRVCACNAERQRREDKGGAQDHDLLPELSKLH
jgi:hypothetical protein